MCGIFSYKGPLDITKVEPAFRLIQHRGPDESQILSIADQTLMGFHRLAIMDLSHNGMQPFHDPGTGDYLVCNGEIYNFEQLKKELAGSMKEHDESFHSHSDCEVLLPLIHKLGFEAALKRLDGEFALIYYSNKENKLYAARDSLGIRPIFFGTSPKDQSFGMASEMKALHPLFSEIRPFPPAHWFKEGDPGFKRYDSLTQSAPLGKKAEANLNQALKTIRETLIQSVEKKIVADAPLGFLLSGGLDSSLVCAIAARKLHQDSARRIETFAVGCHVDAIDIRYARIVADFIGSNHHEIFFSIEEALGALEDVIHSIESWDTTTVRASVGMYLVCQGIRQRTQVKSLLTGEVSDELFGYKYTDFAPSAAEFQKEAVKRIEELHYFDVLRADRCIARHGLEARVPFGDSTFIKAVMAIDPELKLNKTGIGKYLLRKAFENDQLLPPEILLREKAAFSDAVGHSVVDSIKAFAQGAITDKELSKASQEFPHCSPQTKEALYYRRIFARRYPGRDELIPAYWLPNPTWPGCKVTDPSARVLSNYGKSGV